MARRLALPMVLVLAISGVWADHGGFSGWNGDDGTPAISSLFPRSGWSGDTVHILGRNLGETAEDNVVTFGDDAVEVLEANARHLKVAVPEGLTDGEEYAVTVTIGDLTTAEKTFKAVKPGPPAIEEIRPESGPVGTCVKLYGENLGNYGTEVTVLFGGVETTGTSWGRKVYAYVPDIDPLGDVDVKVLVSGVESNEVLFTVTETPPPTIESIDPESASAGRLVRIRGENLSSPSGCCGRGWFSIANAVDGEDPVPPVTVTFGGENARILANSRSRILVVVPAGLDEAEVPVVVNVGEQAAQALFTVLATPTPVVESIEPASGPMGTRVKIRGENLGGYFAAVEVLFGVDETPAEKVWSGFRRSSLYAVAPMGLPEGVHAVTVKVDGMTAALAEGAEPLMFTVEPLPAPVIEGIEPDSGPVGSRVVITGENLSARYLETVVTFGDVTAERVWSRRGWWFWGRRGGSGSSLVAIVPEGLEAVTVRVKVAVAGVESDPVDFAVTAEDDQ